MKKYLSDYAFLFLIAGIIITLDQLSKAWVRANLGMSEIYRPDLAITQYIRIVNWKNYGAAFGIFQNLSGVFTVLSMGVSLLIVYYFPQVPRRDWPLRVAMGMLLGGALGNLIDRLRQGYVTDLISVGSFPVFNVADASISTGVAVLLVGMWLQDRQNARLAARDETAQDVETTDPPAEGRRSENPQAE